jgi:hypothetical protein
VKVPAKQPEACRGFDDVAIHDLIAVLAAIGGMDHHIDYPA